MSEPIWLKRVWVDAIHFQQLQRFGGLYSVRDEGAIESALARPRTLLAWRRRRMTCLLSLNVHNCISS